MVLAALKLHFTLSSCSMTPHRKQTALNAASRLNCRNLITTFPVLTLMDWIFITSLFNQRHRHHKWTLPLSTSIRNSHSQEHFLCTWHPTICSFDGKSQVNVLADIKKLGKAKPLTISAQGTGVDGSHLSGKQRPEWWTHTDQFRPVSPEKFLLFGVYLASMS